MAVQKITLTLMLQPSLCKVSSKVLKISLYSGDLVLPRKLFTTWLKVVQPFFLHLARCFHKLFDFQQLLLLLLVTRSFPRDMGMTDDHGAPEAGQLPRVWTRGRTETESRQGVSAAKSP